jgi:hypothetical protein
MDQNIIKEIKEFDATKSDYISSKITTINKNLLIDYLNNLNNKKNQILNTLKPIIRKTIL